MLQSQVNYWNYVEQRRHNLETEGLTARQVAAQEVSANASRMQAEVAEKLVPFEEMKAQASKAQSDAALQQAQAALQNAETNRGNLFVNMMNAESNARQADAAERNADTNAANAVTNARNADINAWNAAINEYNAETNRINAGANVTNADTNRKQYELNKEDVSSQKDLRQTQMISNIAQTDYTNQKTATEKELTKQAHSNTKYTEAENVMGLVKSGSEVFRNVTGGIGSLFGKNDSSLISTVIGGLMMMK